MSTTGYRAEAERQLDELNAYDDNYLRIDKTYTRVGAAALNEGIAEGFRQLSSLFLGKQPTRHSLPQQRRL